MYKLHLSLVLDSLLCVRVTWLHTLVGGLRPARWQNINCFFTGRNRHALNSERTSWARVPRQGQDSKVRAATPSGCVNKR
ncbi:hypothetical protein V8E53_003550 [Lactarius tabidus]